MIHAVLNGGPHDCERIAMANKADSLTMFDEDGKRSIYSFIGVGPGVAYYEWQGQKEQREKHRHATEILAALMEGHAKALTETGSVQQAAASLRSELENAFLEEFNKGYGQ